MKKILTCAALGLSITAGSLAIATPASAYVLWNLKAEQEGHAICMGVSGGDPGGHVTSGTHIIVWDCNYSSDQAWSFGGYPPGFEWVDAATDTAGHSMCLNDSGGNNDRGAQVTIAECTDYTPQRFLFNWVGNDSSGAPCYNMADVGTNRVVGVANASVNPVQDGMSVVMWDSNGSADQVWCVHPNPVIHIG
jgi:hypothetical protein